MVRISKEIAKELLIERVSYWTDDSCEVRRWAEYLEHFVELLEGDFDPKIIIDNLWINEIRFINKSEIVDNDNLEVGEEINTDSFYGTIDYIGDDFIVIYLR